MKHDSRRRLIGMAVAAVTSTVISTPTTYEKNIQAPTPSERLEKLISQLTTWKDVHEVSEPTCSHGKPTES